MASRAQQKVSASLRAKQSLEHAWERIDFRHDTIAPLLEQIKEVEKTSIVELTEGDRNALLTTGQLAIEEGSSDED